MRAIAEQSCRFFNYLAGLYKQVLPLMSKGKLKYCKIKLKGEVQFGGF